MLVVRKIHFNNIVCFFVMQVRITRCLVRSGIYQVGSKKTNSVILLKRLIKDANPTYCVNMVTDDSIASSPLKPSSYLVSIMPLSVFP